MIDKILIPLAIVIAIVAVVLVVNLVTSDHCGTGCLDERVTELERLHE